MGTLGTRAGNGTAQRLETALLLRAYAAGLFPMADNREAADVFWVEPRRRGILPLADFHLPRSLAKVLKQERFRHSRDQAFRAVVRACAADAPGRQQSWINATIFDAYCRLFDEGHAHSIEIWDADGRLVGGLYGVRLGGAFFGESMFSRETDASKCALAHLVARLRIGGFQLLDTQFLTAHLARFGGREVKRAQYLGLLDQAARQPADWLLMDRLEGLLPQPAVLGTAGPTADFETDLEPDFAPGLAFPSRPPEELGPGAFGPSGKRIVQLLSQTS